MKTKIFRVLVNDGTDADYTVAAESAADAISIVGQLAQDWDWNDSNSENSIYKEKDKNMKMKDCAEFHAQRISAADESWLVDEMIRLSGDTELTRASDGSWDDATFEHIQSCYNAAVIGLCEHRGYAGFDDGASIEVLP